MNDSIQYISSHQMALGSIETITHNILDRRTWRLLMFTSRKGLILLWGEFLYDRVREVISHGPKDSLTERNNGHEINAG